MIYYPDNHQFTAVLYARLINYRHPAGYDLVLYRAAQLL